MLLCQCIDMVSLSPIVSYLRRSNQRSDDARSWRERKFHRAVIKKQETMSFKSENNEGEKQFLWMMADDVNHAGQPFPHVAVTIPLYSLFLHQISKILECLY